MKSAQFSWKPNAGMTALADMETADLVVYFGPRGILSSPDAYSALRNAFPSAILLGCSGGGQIIDEDIDDTCVAGMAMRFERTRIRLAQVGIADPSTSKEAGIAIGKALAGDDLAGVLLLADGLRVDGTRLVEGIVSCVGTNVPLNGGLAGDGASFIETLVGANDMPKTGVIAAVGLYGSAVHIGHGSAGGWNVFGPRRRITRAVGNVLHELDGKPALDLYEQYLGDEAADLPGSGLLFPLRIFDPVKPDHDIVRTVLAIDREARSMTFAGTMPEGWTAQLMRGSFDRLTEGAGAAAMQARLPDNWSGEGAAFLVSCIGRRLLMGQRTNEEILAVRAGLNAGLPMLGFYSYGEISPHSVSGFSELHNQTMTVMTICEAAA